MATLENTEIAELPGRHSASASVVAQSTFEEPVTETEISSLPPTDHGKAAYMVLAGCTLIQAPVWGKPLL